MFVTTILFLLVLYLFLTTKCNTTCGFENPPLQIPSIGPTPESVTGRKEVAGYSGVSDLPSAPINNLGETNSLPYQDPAMVKASVAMLRELKQDMDGFSAFELSNLPDISDPSVKLPITRFKGDSQRVKDEMSVTDRNPGMQPQISVQELNDVAANLRYLQRLYRTYANNEMVPAAQTPMTKVGISPDSEGFENYEEGFYFAKGIGEVCARSTECSTGNCNLSMNPHICTDPQDPSTLTSGTYTSSGDLNSVPAECFGRPGNVPNTSLGHPSPDGGLRYYSKSECETGLAGVSSSNGMCYTERQPDGTLATSTSWSVKCRNMNPASSGSSGSSVPKLCGTDGYAGKDGDGNSIRLYTKAECDKKGGYLHSNGECIKDGYSYSWDCRGLNSLPSGTSSGSTSATSSTLSAAEAALKLYSDWASGTTDASGSTTTVLTSTPSYSSDPNYSKITPTQLDILIQKLAVEITRLQASGSTDPIIQARVNVFAKIKQALNDIKTSIGNGTLRSTDIPILVKDYNNFLPALGNTNAGIASLLSNSGMPSLSSLFNAFTKGDITNSQINNQLLQTYADALLGGLSYKFDISYTSPNEVAARQAEAVKASYDAGALGYAAAESGPMTSGFMSFQPVASGIYDQDSGQMHPMTMDGSRGAFDSYIREMDMRGTVPKSESSGGFDWKKRATNIYENVKRAGMDPYDYGMDPNVFANSSTTDFSWRGYTKMICDRLATNAEPGMAEKMGCPPASWKGWRS